VRFASVYRRFEDVDAFSAEIARMKEGAIPGEGDDSARGG